MSKLIALCTSLLLAVSACGGATSSAKPAGGQAADTARAGLFTPRGSRVGLWLPDGTRRPMRLLAYVVDKPRLSIAIMEMTGYEEKSASEMMAGSVDAMKEKGLKTDTLLTRGGASGVLAQGDAGALPLKALILRQGMAIATTVVQYEPDGEAIADEILESVTLNDRVELDPLAIHGIEVPDLRGFVVSQAMTHPIMLHEPKTKPPFPPGAPGLAIMILPYAKSNPSDEELGQALGGLLADMQPNMEQAKPREFSLSGLPAFDITAPGKKNGVDVAVYGFIARGAESALAGFGDVDKARSQDVLTKFSGLVASIKLDDSIIGSPVAH